MTGSTETYSFSHVDFEGRWEVAWLGDKWDFMLGDHTTWSHYSSEELVDELRTYREAGWPENAFKANFFAKKLEEHFNLDEGKFDYVEILQMSLDKIKKASGYDVFISHASEDKESFVRPLAHALREEGLNVWYDEFCLSWGDELRRSIDIGLADTKFGIIVLSPDFLEKNWPQYELDGLFSRQLNGEKILLPIWHNLTKKDLLEKHPSLVNIVALDSSKNSLDQIAVNVKGKLRALYKA